MDMFTGDMPSRSELLDCDVTKPGDGRCVSSADGGILYFSQRHILGGENWSCCRTWLYESGIFYGPSFERGSRAFPRSPNNIDPGQQMVGPLWHSDGATP